MNPIHLRRMAFVSSLLLGFPSFASEPPPPAPEKPLLSGPSAESAPRQTSLIDRAFDGSLKRLELDPAQAALDLIELTPEERAAAGKILLERNAILDKIVSDNLRLIIELAGAFQGGTSDDKARSFRLLSEAFGKAQPYLDRGRLAEELEGVLPAQKIDRLRALVREYIEAAVNQRLADEKKDGGDTMPPREEAAPREGGRAGRAERGPRRQALAAEVLAIFGQEIKRSYERVIESQGKEFEKFLKQLQLTPEQDGKVRQIIGDLFQKTYGKATKGEQAIAFSKVYQILDAEQRKMLIEQIRAAEAEPAPK